MTETTIKEPGYWSYDPGLLTGYAQFDSKGVVQQIGHVQGLDNLSDFLESIADVPNTIIVEDYIINPSIPQGGTKVVAARAIGRIEHYARIRRIKVEFQPNTIKSIAYRRAGIAVPTKRPRLDEMDAYVHGHHWLIENGIINRKPDLLRKLKRD